MINEKNLLVITLVGLLAISIPVAYADEDEYEDDEYDDDEWEGFGVIEQEREREREHEDDDDDELAIGSGTGDMILYVTIGAIAASIGYTGFKILKSKRPMAQKSK